MQRAGTGLCVNWRAAIGSLLIGEENAAAGMGFIAFATLALVFVGIYNAWDTITYIATDHGRAERDARPPGP